jgi:hypothetical protein
MRCRGGSRVFGPGGVDKDPAVAQREELIEALLDLDPAQGRFEIALAPGVDHTASDRDVIAAHAPVRVATVPSYSS